jgi:hypothetical protein
MSAQLSVLVSGAQMPLSDAKLDQPHSDATTAKPDHPQNLVN